MKTQATLKEETVSFVLDSEDVLKSVGTFIFVFTDGTKADQAYEPLPRYPKPEVDWPLNEDLKRRLKDAFQMNSSIHDGALIFKKSNEPSCYLAGFWSCRLMPQKNTKPHTVNKGVAWNSCMAMSSVDGVDFVILYSKSEFIEFESGTVGSVIRNKSDQ